MIGRALLIVTTASIVAATADCHHAPRTTSVAIAPDSIRGIVSITGTGFEKAIMLRSGASTIRLAPNAADSAGLSRLGGVDVLVVGTREPSQFRVSWYRAMTVAGAPVVDGVLRAEGSNLFLETPTGRVALGNPPAPLRNLIGARIWIGGALDNGPNTYGVITPPR